MDNVEQTAKRTHSPSGEYAATDANYVRLLARLKNGRPVAHPSLWTQSRKWAAVACVALVCGLSWAAFSHDGFLRGLWPNVSEPTDSLAPASPLSFVDVPLAEVLSELCRHHSVALVVQDSTVASMRVTAQFAPDEPLPESLEALQMVSGADISLVGQQVFLR